MKGLALTSIEIDCGSWMEGAIETGEGSRIGSCYIGEVSLLAGGVFASLTFSSTSYFV